MTFTEELRRRKVFRVGIAYAISAWVVVQVADIATESFAAPDWVMKTLFTAVVLGFFASLVLAWAFQVTGQGVQRDQGGTEQTPASGSAGGRWQALLFVLLVGVIGYLLYDKFLLDPRPGVLEPMAAPVEASVAVLPFVNMSANADNEYFSDGLTDTLLHKLAQVQQLKVAARTSSFAFKNTNTDIREIAAQLSVGNVLEGSVQRAGDTVRITAQLIQAEDGYHLWSGTFDRRLDDIFAVQDEIAAEVAAALTGSLLADDGSAGAADGGTANTEAYDLYLRARDAARADTERKLAEAQRLLRRAVSLDPGFALAWSALAEAIVQYARLAGLSWDEYNVEAEYAANRGVELAPTSSVTVGVKGYLAQEWGEYKQAQALLEQALELDPGNVWAWSRLADTQFSQGQFLAAADSASQAMRLDPLDYDLKARSTFKFLQIGRVDEARALADAILAHDPDSYNGISSLANIEWRTGQLAAAYRLYHRGLEINPNNLGYVWRQFFTFIQLGELDGAERWAQRAEAINPDRARTTRARLCQARGDHECARSIWQQLLAETDPLDPDQREYHLGLQVDLARLSENWELLLETTLASAELAAERGSSFSSTWDLINAAYAADRLARFDERDAYLLRVEEEIARDFANGSNSQYSYLHKSTLLALGGDVQGAVESLDRAIELGFRDLGRVYSRGYFDKLLDQPLMVDTLNALRGINAAELAKLHQAVAELEGIPAPATGES